MLKTRCFLMMKDIEEINADDMNCGNPSYLLGVTMGSCWDKGSFIPTRPH